MFAETDVQSEHESMSVVLLIVFLISLDVYIFRLLLKSVLLLVL